MCPGDPDLLEDGMGCNAFPRIFGGGLGWRILGTRASWLKENEMGWIGEFSVEQVVGCGGATGVLTVGHLFIIDSSQPGSNVFPLPLVQGLHRTPTE